jgi:hypothetical protein
MTSTHRNARRIVLAAAVIAVAATACSRGNDTPHAAPATAAPVPPAVIVAIPQPPEITVDLGDSEPSDSSTPDFDLDDVFADNPLDRLFFDGDTDGTGPQIALRFVQALQRRDDLAAARTLTTLSRLSLSNGTMPHLHRVMGDVAKNARLASAGRCTTARALTREAAVVHCGTQRIVVHVLADRWSSGVQIDPWHPQYDVYRGPHTHAYTALDL